MEKRELLIISNVLNNEYGFKFILLLIEQLGAFERGINFNLKEQEIFKILGKREQGQWLLDIIQQADFEKYIEIMKKGVKNE